MTLAGWRARFRGVDALDLDILAATVLDKNRAYVLANPELPLTPRQTERLTALAGRCEAGEPLAYVLGQRAFWRSCLHVNPAVLIPRPETELLVELTLQHTQLPAAVLELGTGSGAIAIALAMEAGFTITATDRSPAALQVARENWRRCRERCGTIAFLQADWFTGVTGRFATIVSNPPYVAEGDEHLPALRHEPVSALVAGSDGLAALRRIVAGASAFLEDHGHLIVEHGADQGEAVHALFAAAGFSAIATHPDLAGLPRATLGQLTTRHSHPLVGGPTSLTLPTAV